MLVTPAPTFIVAFTGGFQEWNDRKAERVTYFKRMSQRSYTVRIVYCTPLQAYKLESGLIKMYEPRDNLTQWIGIV